MDLSLDLFADVEPAENKIKASETNFFASDDLFADVKAEQEISEESSDLFDAIEVENDSDEDDLFDIILDETSNTDKSKVEKDINPNTSVLYAVPGVHYGHPDDFPEMTQIKERFLSELMSDF